jgi:hypothetical protein
VYIGMGIVILILLYIAAKLRQIQTGLTVAAAPTLLSFSPGGNLDTKFLRLIAAQLHFVLQLQASHNASDRDLSAEREKTINRWVLAHARMLEGQLDEDFLDKRAVT